MRTKKKALPHLLDKAIAEHGTKRVHSVLSSLISDSRTNVLTIIANQGSHKIPAKYLRGELFVASTGNLDFSSSSRIKKQFLEILRNTRNKLNQKSWKKIYLIPTGHPTLSIQLKVCVYRITRINTTDVFYYGGKYCDLDIDVRNIDD